MPPGTKSSVVMHVLSRHDGIRQHRNQCTPLVEIILCHNKYKLVWQSSLGQLQMMTFRANCLTYELPSQAQHGWHSVAIMVPTCSGVRSRHPQHSSQPAWSNLRTTAVNASYSSTKQALLKANKASQAAVVAHDSNTTVRGAQNVTL